MTRSASLPRYEVETRLGVRVPVRDGLELSANLWLPRGTDPTVRFPAILELIPYSRP
jgi:predicted acyl esterase